MHKSVRIHTRHAMLMYRDTYTDTFPIVCMQMHGGQTSLTVSDYAGKWIMEQSFIDRQTDTQGNIKAWINGQGDEQIDKQIYRSTDG